MSDNKRISQEVLAVLSQGKSEGNSFYLGGEQLERKLYLDVNKVLEALGAAWNKKAKAHVFPIGTMAADAIDVAILSESYLKATAGDFFPTPHELAVRAAELLYLKNHMTVLEPSAGVGNLLQGLLEGTDANFYFDFCEISESRAKTVFNASLENRGRLLGGNFVCSDFLSMPPNYTYDRIIMNPPFARLQDVDHVTKAFTQHLNPGGVLVAFMSAGLMFRKDRKVKTFVEDILVPHRTHTQELLPGAFKVSGTNVRTVLVRLDKCHGMNSERPLFWTLE